MAKGPLPEMRHPGPLAFDGGEVGSRAHPGDEAGPRGRVDEMASLPEV